MSAVKPTLVPVITPSKKRSLAKRELISWGGYGLQISPCPGGTASCGDSCCPNGYNCAHAGDHKNNFSPTEAICCPTNTDCSATVRVVPACADTSWGLYHAIAQFCCPSDFVGIYPDGGTGPMCFSKTLPIPQSKLASSVDQATNTGAAVSTASGSATRSASPGIITSGSDPQSTPASTTSGSSESGLSHGATIAIAVLAAALGLLVIFVIGYFWRKKRPLKSHIPPFSIPPPAESVHEVARPFAPARDPEAQPAAAKTAESQVNELSETRVLQSAEVPELDTARRAELIATGQVRAELHASGRVQ